MKMLVCPSTDLTILVTDPTQYRYVLMVGSQPCHIASCTPPQPNHEPPTMSSRTIVDVPTILDPSSGGKKRRRDESEAEEETDARSMARLISTVLSGPHPAPVVHREGGGGGADGSGVAASGGKDTTDDGGEENPGTDQTGGEGGEDESKDDKTAKQDRKAELLAQIAAAKAENEANDARRRDAFSAYANLSSVYNYGLSHIAKLNDLSGAPDNTLPGSLGGACGRSLLSASYSPLIDLPRKACSFPRLAITTFEPRLFVKCSCSPRMNSST